MLQSFNFMKDAKARKSTFNGSAGEPARNKSSGRPKRLSEVHRGRSAILARRGTRSSSGRSLYSSGRDSLFVPKREAHDPVNVNDLDEETLQALMGAATHLSLNRRGSKGVMQKIPSCERFRGVISPRASISFTNIARMIPSPRRCCSDPVTKPGLTSTSSFFSDDWVLENLQYVEEEHDGREDDSSDNHTPKILRAGRTYSHTRMSRQSSNGLMVCRLSSKERMTSRDKRTLANN